jgi:hypothetical protein
MPTYLVERYAPERSGDASGPGATPPAGMPDIRHVLSTLIPDDEIALSLFEAPSVEALAGALAARRIAYIRIVEAVVQDMDRDDPPAFAGE